MAAIAWIGLGQMGRPMAANLVRAGHDVRGVDVSSSAVMAARELGIDVYDSVGQAVQGADAVFTMLPDGAFVEGILTGPEGLFAAAGPDTPVVDCSTIDISTCQRLHLAAHEVGADFVDAPVLGGVKGAESGSLTIMAGGREPSFEQVRPLLELLGDRVIRMGEGGAGQATKVVNNMILGVCLAATCEGLALAGRLNLDPAALYEVVTHSSGDNWALRSWYPAPGVRPDTPSSRDFAPGFTTSLLLKDLGLALKAGGYTGVPLATVATAQRLFDGHAAEGFGGKDCSSLILSLQAAVGAPDADLAHSPDAV